jgi:hypothetical protein
MTMVRLDLDAYCAKKMWVDLSGWYDLFNKYYIMCRLLMVVVAVFYITG